MKIFYIANSRIPTEKAHGIQIMKMCEAFARAGHEISLLVPKRKSHISDEAFAYYGMQKSFDIVYLWTVDLIHWSGWVPKVFAYLQNWSFSWSVQKYLDKNQADLLFTRDELTALSLPKNSEIILEIHNISRILRVKIARLNKLTKIITITRGLKDELVRLGYDAGRIEVLADGVDLNQFSTPSSSPPSHGGEKKVVYTGNLFAWKGVYVLAEVAKLLPEHEFIFVGGSLFEQKNFENYITRQPFVDRQMVVKNIKLIGHVRHSDIPKYLADADVLVLPNSSKTDISKYYTSPLKMFEYMAAGKPLVASDLPSIREILSESNSVLVKPDDPAALAEGIKKVLQDNELAKRISEQAKKDVQQYDWSIRAKKILELAR